MNDSIIQRLIGAVVLICVALILWPMVFSEYHGPPLNQQSEIPTMPTFTKYTVDEPVRSDKIEPVQAAKLEKQPIVSPDQQKIVSDTDQKPQLDDRGLPEAWVLQVASFTEASNAEDLNNNLKQKGYKSFTREISSSEGPTIRV